jgi:arabinan endo-1,5-alpha-L-arabinosidase
VDEGRVVGSTAADDWNAIDPNLAFDERGSPWLVWGSFWGGIKMRRVDPETGKLSPRDSTLHSLASRRPLKPPAIEAPFIVRKGKHFYLFVSFDMCCRGKDSTYKVMVGRSKRITGPYAARDGTPMMEGGGTLLLEGDEAWRGPGHPAVLLGSDADLLVYHAYDGTSGRPTLRISTMSWEHGWPTLRSSRAAGYGFEGFAASSSIWRRRIAHQSLCSARGMPHSRQTRIRCLGGSFPAPNNRFTSDMPPPGP